MERIKDILDFIDNNKDYFTKIYVVKNEDSAYISLKNEKNSLKYEFDDVNFFDREILLKIIDRFTKRSGIVDEDDRVLTSDNYMILFKGYDEEYLNKVKSLVDNSNLIKMMNKEEEEDSKAYISVQVLITIIMLAVMFIVMLFVAR